MSVRNIESPALAKTLRLGSGDKPIPGKALKVRRQRLAQALGGV